MRIAALSDQHGFLPTIPSCDLVLVAGDVCPDLFRGVPARVAPDLQARWFNTHARPWLAGAPATAAVLTWGNHDFCGQACDFSADAPGSASSSLQIVVDAVTTIGGLSIWATPWSNKFMNWAFMKSPSALARIYDAIPAGIDILVSHQPPYGCGDRVIDVELGRVRSIGSRELLRTIKRIRPRVVICGHLHEGHGRYLVDDTAVYNVSVVNERYELVHAVTTFEIAGRGAN